MDVTAASNRKFNDAPVKMIEARKKKHIIKFTGEMKSDLLALAGERGEMAASWQRNAGVHASQSFPFSWWNSKSSDDRMKKAAKA